MSKIVAITTHQGQIDRVLPSVVSEQELAGKLTPAEFYKLGADAQKALLDDADLIIADHILLTARDIAVKSGTLVDTKELLEQNMGEGHPSVIWMNVFGLPRAETSYPSFTASSGSDATLKNAIRQALHMDETHL